MKYKFSILERIILERSLPRRGKYKDNIARKELRELVSFDSDTLEEIEFSLGPNGEVTYNDDKEKEGSVEVKLNDAHVRVLKKFLKDADKKEELPEQANKMYENFVIEE